jgi:hypothetical protein
MWAILAVIAFIIALILHIVGGGAAKYVLDFELAGFICIALQLAFGWGVPSFTRRAPPA